MYYLKYYIFIKSILFILIFGSCLQAADLRIIKVHLLYDKEFISNPIWEENINKRFTEINKFYNDKFDLHWEISKKSKYDFEGDFKNISDVFSQYRDRMISVLNKSDEEIIVCIIGKDIPGKGIAGVFSRLVMISDSSHLKDRNSGVIIAHELGHLFGAWHIRNADDLMYQRGARYYKAGAETTSMIKLMRNYNFNVSSLLNNPKLLKRISRLVMISDSSHLKDRDSGVIIAHELGHLFGAWHSRKADDLMYQRGARHYKAGVETTSMIKLMRNYNFDVFSLLNNPKLLKRISRLYRRFHARSEADPAVRRYSLNEVNPVARLYADQGIIHLKNKNYIKAVEALENSVKYDVGWGKNRILLAKAYYEVSRYNESFLEYSRSVFFGAKPDKVFKEKLRNKFIELKKSNPQLTNPFDEVNSD